jgi:hypothetical protein
MSHARDALLTQLGYRFGESGTHAARTLMLEDVCTLFSRVPPNGDRVAFTCEIVERNGLGKATKKTRELAVRHLAMLYGLSPQFVVYRAFRRLWAADESARPLLAMMIALARDPLLRRTQDVILTKPVGEVVMREEVEASLDGQYQGRLSSTSLRSIAQNINGSWTQAGFLSGRVRKTRTMPLVTPANVVLALFLGYLEGLSGQRLFSSPWISLLGISPDETEVMTIAASHRDLLVFLTAGGIREVRFPGYLSAEEDRWRQEATRV